MTRNTAEAILLTNAKEGTYLLRDSGTNIGQYTISVRYVQVFPCCKPETI